MVLRIHCSSLWRLLQCGQRWLQQEQEQISQRNLFPTWSLEEIRWPCWCRHVSSSFTRWFQAEGRRANSAPEWEMQQHADSSARLIRHTRLQRSAKRGLFVALMSSTRNVPLIWGCTMLQSLCKLLVGANNEILFPFSFHVAAQWRAVTSSDNKLTPAASAVWVDCTRYVYMHSWVKHSTQHTFKTSCCFKWSMWEIMSLLSVVELTADINLKLLEWWFCQMWL